MAFDASANACIFLNSIPPEHAGLQREKISPAFGNIGNTNVGANLFAQDLHPFFALHMRTNSHLPSPGRNPNPQSRNRLKSAFPQDTKRAAHQTLKSDVRLRSRYRSIPRNSLSAPSPPKTFPSQSLTISIDTRSTAANSKTRTDNNTVCRNKWGNRNYTASRKSTASRS
jgi:hypothetical protein